MFSLSWEVGNARWVKGVAAMLYTELTCRTAVLWYWPLSL